MRLDSLVWNTIACLLDFRETPKRITRRRAVLTLWSSPISRSWESQYISLNTRQLSRKCCMYRRFIAIVAESVGGLSEGEAREKERRSSPTV